VLALSKVDLVAFVAPAALAMSNVHQHCSQSILVRGFYYFRPGASLPLQHLGFVTWHLAVPPRCVAGIAPHTRKTTWEYFVRVS